MVLFFCVTFYFQTITHFSFTIHVLQKDKCTGKPKIWLYHDKETNEPKGDATVTYEDPHAAVAAVEWFNNKDFHGNTIGVYIPESKNKDDQHTAFKKRKGTMKQQLAKCLHIFLVHL